MDRSRENDTGDSPVSRVKRICAGRADDVPAYDALTVEIDGRCVAVFRDNGHLFAITNICPHAGGHLDQGFVENGRVTCPWHGWSFPLRIEGAPDDGLERYPLTVENGEIYIEIPVNPNEIAPNGV